MAYDPPNQSPQSDYSHSKPRSGRSGEGQDRRSGPGMRRRQPPVKLENIDWKDMRTLRPFLDDAGRIRPRRKTGASAKTQRSIARAVKQARFMALLP